MYFIFLLSLLVVIYGSEKNKEKLEEFVPPAPLPYYINPGLAIAIKRQNFKTDQFNQVANDVHCSGGQRLSRQSKKSREECKRECVADKRCSHFAHWPEKKFCETYVDCPAMVEDKENPKIQLWLRTTVCEQAIAPGSASQGYLSMLISDFPELSHEGPNRNMQCSCATSNVMICAVFYEPNSEDPEVQTFAKAVLLKLQRDDEEALKPFYLMESDSRHFPRPILFIATCSDTRQKIFSEIEPTQTSQCMHIDMCSGTPGNVCPILGTVLTTRQPVLVLKNEDALVKAGKPVACISLAGMRVLASDDDNNEGLVDPFEREEGRGLFIMEDYNLYWIFDSEDLIEGICKTGAIMKDTGSAAASIAARRRRPRGGKTRRRPGKGKGGLSEASSSQDVPDSEDSPFVASSPGEPSSSEPGPSEEISYQELYVVADHASPLNDPGVPLSKLVRKRPPFSGGENHPLPCLAPPPSERVPPMTFRTMFGEEGILKDDSPPEKQEMGTQTIQGAEEEQAQQTLNPEAGEFSPTYVQNQGDPMIPMQPELVPQYPAGPSNYMMPQYPGSMYPQMQPQSQMYDPSWQVEEPMYPISAHLHQLGIYEQQQIHQQQQMQQIQQMQQMQQMQQAQQQMQQMAAHQVSQMQQISDEAQQPSTQYFGHYHGSETAPAPQEPIVSPRERRRNYRHTAELPGTGADTSTSDKDTSKGKGSSKKSVGSSFERIKPRYVFIFFIIFLTCLFSFLFFHKPFDIDHNVYVEFELNASEA